MPGTLFVVATPIGNLDDITIRALRVLREVALIAAEDTRRTGHLLIRHGISTPTTSLHEHNERKKGASLVARLAAGDSLALVSDAGTPTISDPGMPLIRAAIEAGIRIEPIPGPNAAVTALSVSGLMTDSFTFLGFPPIRSKDRNMWLEQLRATAGAAVFYEAPHRIHATLSDVVHAVGDRPALVARELTKAHEELVRGPISTLFGQLKSSRGEFTVVVDVGCEAPAAPSVRHQIGQTIDFGVGKRQAVAALADQVGVSANDLYKAIEKLKNIGQ